MNTLAMTRPPTRTWTTYESPLGRLTLVAGPDGLTDLNFPGRMQLPADAVGGELPEIADQLDAYFAGELRAFDVALDLRGTPLQRAVWRALLDIPYGETESYGALAARVDPDAFVTDTDPWRRARVVGSANGANPVSVIVPCHRVIGADGSLTGYGGGLDRKAALLALERRVSGGPPPPVQWSQRQISLL